MHGIIGQLATDPVRLVIAVLAVIAIASIIHCLSGLAFFRRSPDSPFDSEPPAKERRDEYQPTTRPAAASPRAGVQERKQ